MNQTTPKTLEQVVIRFAGDSGDGMQLLGGQFTQSTAFVGNDLATQPDFPAEIRAPAGTRAGVSGFQIQFASRDIFTPGDQVDVLVAMNPAALVTNIHSLNDNGIVVVNTDKFRPQDLAKAMCETNPLEDGSLDNFRVVAAQISELTKGAVSPYGLNVKQADRCKNFFALGMMYWLYNRSLGHTEEWLKTKFKAPYLDANIAALRAGYNYGNTIELFQTTYEVQKADLPKGTYRNITGNHALALGLATVAVKGNMTVFYGSYPITPASDILHALAPFKNFKVVTYQAEDEIAAVCAAIGASYGGSLGVCGTSGPGIALKAEAMGLAVMAELPLLVINVQRAGPSTGLPTKPEQSDLLQAMYGRNGEAPVAILAPSTPSDCFEVIQEAAKLTMKYMTPVILLSDGYIGTGSEPWQLPPLDSLPDPTPTYQTLKEDFLPYTRDEDTLARPWAIPGTAGLEHRIGGLEKEHLTGNVSYDPENHQFMCELRAEKIRRMQADIPPIVIHGDDKGILVLGWGSTYGAIRTAVDIVRKEGQQVGHVHLRHLNPFPKDLEQTLNQFDQVLIPEMNLGQLSKLIRAEMLIDTISYCKIQGQSFQTSELADKIRSLGAS